jgi:hypothetical protein
MPTTLIRRIARTAILAAGTALLCASAYAADPAGGGCNPNEARNDPAACKRESGAAALEAKRGNLTSPGAAAGSNATDRCKALTGSERSDCVSRAAGSSTTSSGSVQSGGIVRETVTNIPPAKP